MAEIIKRSKPLAVNPLKSSAPLGAALAFLGLRRAIPMLHGAQGCTAFGKVFFVRHFREPIPLQSTGMDHVATVMGADENVVEGLRTLCEKSHPDVIGLPTTGLAETQGSDTLRTVKEFRAKYPAYADVAIVPVSAPDFNGSLESGFAFAVEAIINALVPHTQGSQRRRQTTRQVNILANASLTPGDLETIREWCEAFGLQPIILPDLGDSLDGHLIDAQYSTLTPGGTPREAISRMGESIATLLIGHSMRAAAQSLHARTGVPDFLFPHLVGLDACDAFTSKLAELSGEPVPARIERHRAQLQDAMVDSHFHTGTLRVALGGEPDLLAGLADLLVCSGAELVAVTAAVHTPTLATLPCAVVRVGDLQDLERDARGARAQIIVCNSHASQAASRLGIPLLRAGFPQYDRAGAQARSWVGYRGARQALFDITNLVLEHHHDIAAYRSVFWAGGPRDLESRNTTEPASCEPAVAPH